MHSRPLATRLGVLLGLALAGAATTATPAAEAAPDRDAREARSSWQKGKRALAAGRHQEAEEALCGAMELQPIPQHVIDCARALVAREDWRNAHAVLLPWADAEDELTATERRTVRALWTKVESRAARVRVEVLGQRDRSIELQIDGQDVLPVEAVVLAPGPHQARVIVDGGKAVVRRVVAKAGAEVVARIDVGAALGDEVDADAPLAPEATSDADDDDDGSGTLLPGAIALAGSGLALGVGATFGVLAATTASDVRARCNGNTCPAEVAGDAQTSAMYGDVSTASFVIAGALALGGVGLLVAFGGDDEPTVGGSTPRSGSAALFVGPQAAGMRGSF
jgi:hypothetical protein